MILTEDFIKAGAKGATETTYGNRYHSEIPDVKMEDDGLHLGVGTSFSIITSLDETILTILVKFLFCPIWLIKQMYYSVSELYDEAWVEETINSWISVGIAWKEPSVTGQYLRPTYALFNLFGMDPYPYVDIPFNTLTHTIGEEKVFFDILNGISEIVKMEEIVTPRISELGFPPDKSGTNAIIECDFRNPKLFQQDGIDEINYVENAILQGIKDGSSITPELEDFKYFVEVKKINSTGSVKRDYKFHIPDLVIPIPRNKGLPQSIAVEVELSNKTAINYQESIIRYKDSKKYGSVYWLCRNGKIAQAIRQAFDDQGGAGSTKMTLLEFTVPFPEKF